MVTNPRYAPWRRLLQTYPLVWSLLVFALGTGAAMLAAFTLHSAVASSGQMRFDRHVENLRGSIKTEVDRQVDLLLGVRGLYAASETVSRQEFAQYMGAVNFERSFPSVDSVSVVARVSSQGLEQFQTQMRKQIPGYTLLPKATPPAAGPDWYVVMFSEPESRVDGFLGLELAADPRRLAGMSHASLTGEAGMTAPLVLAQGQQTGVAYSIYLPIYAPSNARQEAERTRELTGFAATTFFSAKLFRQASAATGEWLNFVVYDGEGWSAVQVAGEASGGAAQNHPNADQATSLAAATHQARFELNLAGRNLHVHVAGTPSFESSLDREAPWVLGGAGTAASAALALVVWLLATAKRRAQERAEAMNADLDRLARVVRGTTNAVVITDVQGRMVWVNEAYTRITGYSAEESIGQVPGHFLQCEGTDRSEAGRIGRAVRAGQPVQAELLNRAKDGREYWLSLDIQPQFSEDGVLQGFMAVEQDITESRLAQAQLLAAQRDLQTTNAMARIGTWEVDVVRQTVFWSPVTREIHEVEDSFQPSLAMGIEFYLEGHDRARIAAVVQRAIEQAEPWDEELRIVTHKGRIRWVRALGTPQLEGGRCVKLYGSFQDIDERVREQEQLRIERQRLASILEGTHAGTWEWNVQTGESHFNETWAELIGYTLAELAPVSVHTWTGLTHPGDLLVAQALLQRHFSGELPYYDCIQRMRHKQGHWVWIHDRGKVISRTDDGQPLMMMGTHTDISEIKRAEDELRASQEFLERAERVAGVGGWAVDLRTQQFTWTRQAALLHGLDPEDPPSARRALSLYDPEHQGPLRAALQRSVEGGEPWALEASLTESGGQRWLRVVAQTEMEDGQPVRVLGAVQDVTHMRALQETLRAANTLLQSVIDNIPLGLCVYDQAHRLVLHNEAYAQVLDLPPELLQEPGMNFERLTRFQAERGEYGEDELEAQVRAVVEAARLPMRRHFERIRPNGDVIDVRGAPLPDGGFVAVYANVTEQRRVQREVAEKERTLRGAIDAVDEAFVLYDDQDRLVFCNDKYRAYYPRSADLFVPGARFEDIIRQGAERGEYVDALGRVDEWVDERLSKHRMAHSESVNRLSNGTWLRVIERKTADGYTVGFRIDITQLKTAVEVAEAASRSKSQFLANMSHEIRTPMNAVLGMLQLLQGTRLDTRQRDYVAKTESAARALLGLLNDILDFSKVEAGKLSLDPRPTSLERLVGDMGTVLSTGLGDKPVELVLDLDPALPGRVVVDDLRLRQVLVNLAGNAIKFTSAGEVVVALRQRERLDGEVCLEVSVSDTGIGIAPEHLGHIFTGFSQAEASTTRRFGGTGLGLAICQRLVALMGGQLRVESTPAVGSRFFFEITLPVVPWVEEAGSRVGEPPEVATPTRQALLLDDSSSARAVTRRLLEQQGWTVHAVSHAAQARAWLQQGPRPDLLLVDAHMPGASGVELCVSWRLEPAWAAAPMLLMVTPHGQRLLDEKASGADALVAHDGVVLKPLTASTLHDAVVSVLQASSQRAIAQRPPHRGDPSPALQASAPTPGPGSRAPSDSPRDAAQALAGMRILLVEDNPINQQVAQELLSAQGASVDIAGNGRLGVQALCAAQAPGPVRGGYHAVLMDLQMPVMDGLAATQQIRSLGYHDLPVIAMTANAMSSDRDACLQAGMNEHIGKPFDLAQLVALLRRLTRWSAMPLMADAPANPAVARAPEAPEAPSSRPAAAESTEPVTAEPVVLDVFGALERLGGRLDTLTRLQAQWQTELAQLPDQLQHHGSLGQRQEVARLLHTLKGNAGTLGALRLAQVADAAERAFKAHHYPDAARLVEALRPALEETQAALLRQTSSAREGATTAAPLPLNGHEALEGVQQLQTLLAAGDMAALQAVEALRQRHEALWSEATTRDAAAALARAVLALDFAEAQRGCERLRQLLA